MRRFLESDPAEIRIFSRDEEKQEDMRKAYKSPKLKFRLGDLRNPNSVRHAMHGANLCFMMLLTNKCPPVSFTGLKRSRPMSWVHLTSNH